MSIVRSPVSSVVSSPVRSVLGGASSGGGGGATALSLIQTAYQAGDFAAYWGIQDGIMYNSTTRAVTDTATGGGTALMPDKAAFQGDETVTEYVSRVGLVGLAVDNIPGFPGYQNTGTYEPRMDGLVSPKLLEQSSSDENLRIRNSTGYTVGATAHTVVLAIRTTDTDFMTIGDSAAIRFAGRVRNAGSAADSFAGNPAYRVDGVDIIGDLANALFAAGVSDGTWSILTIQNLDLTGWTGDMVIGGRVITGSDGFNMDGDIAYVAIFPDDTATRDLAEAEAAALVSITLP